MPDFDRVLSLFHQALAAPLEKRRELLEQTAASDPELAAQVRALLAKDESLQARETGMPAGPDGAALSSPKPSPSESAGDWIGPYRLLEVIGEGGFGMVYLAERRKPMVQRVAIKIVKPGMDSRAVIARFEQERQALALMNHPNVARVFDGGVTSQGRPYFVMEYVDGEPITRFCDRHAFTIRKRLELFIPVCEAVQHAHTKGSSIAI